MEQASGKYSIPCVVVVALSLIYIYIYTPNTGSDYTYLVTLDEESCQLKVIAFYLLVYTC